MFELLPFQKTYIASALADGVSTACLSIGRGNGKSSLLALLALWILTPGHAMFADGQECFLVASSVGQARRTTFGILRRMLDGNPEYRIADSAANHCRVLHKPTGTRLSVLPANFRGAQGLVNCPYLLADECGAWEVRGGEKMWDSIETAQGKPDSDMRVLAVGTIAPALPGSWWHELVTNGSKMMTRPRFCTKWKERESI